MAMTKEVEEFAIVVDDDYALVLFLLALLAKA
jgi:hypothetical protein